MTDVLQDFTIQWYNTCSPCIRCNNNFKSVRSLERISHKQHMLITARSASRKAATATATATGRLVRSRFSCYEHVDITASSHIAQ